MYAMFRPCLITSLCFCFCVEATPIATYLTWQRQPDSTMTVQWITPLEEEADRIEYCAANEEDWHLMEGSHRQMPDELPYLIHRVEIVELMPETEYLFRIIDSEEIRKFRTMPAQLSYPIQFVVGGDIYRDDIESVSKMNLQITKHSPAFALLGGDITYESGMYSHRQPNRWIEWLELWSNQMITREGYSIPLIPAIGNHETDGSYGQTPEQAQSFYALFRNPDDQGYNALDFGDYLSLFILDSGHTHPIDGAQTEWLSQALASRTKVTHKFALYHVGAYPSVSSYNGDVAKKIRAHWVPVFEQYGLTAAFEHHDHTYKRTHLLRKGKPDSSGVLYLGDGAWGVSKARIPDKPKKRAYLAKSVAKKNIIVVAIDQQHRYYTAVDPEGNIIDFYKH